MVSMASPADLPTMIGLFARLQAQAQVRLAMMQVGQAETSPSTLSETGEYLTVNEVADRFNVSQKFLYRNKKKMPYSQPTRKCLLFPEKDITRWFASRRG